jgi:hypothetical protein
VVVSHGARSPCLPPTIGAEDTAIATSTQNVGRPERVRAPPPRAHQAQP